MFFNNGKDLQTIVKFRLNECCQHKFPYEIFTFPYEIVSKTHVHKLRFKEEDKTKNRNICIQIQHNQSRKLNSMVVYSATL